MTDQSGSGDDEPSAGVDGPTPGDSRAETHAAGPPAGLDHHALREAQTPEDVSTTGADDIDRCDYCRLPIPATALQHERDGVTYRFCSGACRDSLLEQEQVFTEYHGHRRLSTGVSVLDASLPQGVPRNSFVMLSEVAGSRVEAVQAELAWRALQRGDPVVFATFLEPPVSVVQSFIDMEWNVLPSLERGDLQILDCFSYRVEDRDRMYERMNAWNRHLWDVASDATTTVRDPSDMSELQNRIDGVLEDEGMHDRGIVVVDSLVELGSLVQPVQAYNFLKDVRADVCKGRFVPIFAGATVSQDSDGFPHDLEYMVDGIVELRLSEELVENALINQLRVRKMSGVLTYPQWQAFEYTQGAGAVAFDPVAHQQQSEGGGGDRGSGGRGSGGGGSDGRGSGGGGRNTGGGDPAGSGHGPGSGQGGQTDRDGRPGEDGRPDGSPG